MPAEAAIALLAGGSARRFPGKLTAQIDGTPLVVRTYERVRGVWPVCVVVGSSFEPAIDARLDCPLVVDRWPGTGPLGALLSAAMCRREPIVVGVAADLPNLDRATLERILDACGDTEAVVPRCEGRLQPLVAAYARSALEREGFALLRRGERSMHALLERLRVRTLTFAPHAFHNVNRPSDLEAIA